MTDGLSGVQLHLVDNTETAAEFIRWMGERRPLNAIAIDTETGELPGNPREHALSPWHGRLRLVQVGDAMQGWSIPWEDWKGVFYQAMRSFDGPIVCHNIAFEARWFDVQSSWDIPWRQAHDTMIMAHIIDPLGSGALKRLASLYVDPKAAALQQRLDEDLTANGWTWGTVPINFDPYWSYGALDPVITMRIFNQFYPDCGPGGRYSETYELEMATRKIVTRMEINGARVDLDYSKKKHDELLDYAESVKEWAALNYGGVSISSNIQLVRAFEALGAEFSEFTPSGAKSASKDQLKRFLIDEKPEIRALAEAVVNQRKADKLATTYFANFLNNHVDGVLHPSVKTLGARTGRMCIPETHKLFSNRGILDVSEVRIGDQTIDHNGKWTTVTNIHRYPHEEVVSWGYGLESTRNHRWVWKYEDRNKVHIEPTRAGKRHILQLTPAVDDVFSFENLELTVNTDGERFAALIGMLITDGRCVEGGLGVGMRATVYQTEKKFYNTLLSVIPTEAIMYDTSREYATGIVHEIRIKTRWLRPRLVDAGLVFDTSLKDSPALVSWVSDLPINELRAFLKAAFLCDGSTSVANQKILTSQSENTRTAFQIAGYRLGYGSSIVESTNTGFVPGSVSYSVRFRRGTYGLRTATESVRTTDVWCVSTESGTFTAWNIGPYLTGNSITDPALQTLPSGDATVRRAFLPKDDNHVIISSDLDQVEFRLVAAMSEDKQLIDLFARADAEHGDAFTEIMREIYQDDSLQKSDPRRRLVKGTVYGKLYGAGVAKMALTAGVPFDQMKTVVDAFDSSYPGIKMLQQAIENIGMRRLREEGQGYVLTKTGRRLPCDSDRVYSLTNYLVQSSAAEVFKRNLIKLDEADLTELLIVPVHDEIVLQAPREDVAEVMRTVQECMTTREGWAVPLTAGVDGPFENWGEKYQ